MPCRRHLKQLQLAIMGIRWQDKITNIEVLDRVGLSSVEALILKAQLRWTCHVICMESSCTPWQVFYRVLSQCNRNMGQPRKHFKDCNISAKAELSGDAQHMQPALLSKPTKGNGSTAPENAKGLSCNCILHHFFPVPLLSMGVNLKNWSCQDNRLRNRWSTNIRSTPNMLDAS